MAVHRVTLTNQNMKIQKLILAFSLSIFFALAAQAQDKPSPAQTAEGEVAGAKITIKYSSPAVKGRTIWGDLVPFGKIWRAGANDATTFTTSKDITVEGQKLAAGTYSFFVIPGESTSTFVFNCFNSTF